jgi:threonylcarbamoyladenosine tRNA methylthiotransferase MtaB
VFAYSRRAGTPASTYEGQIPESVKRERSERLIRAGHDARDELLTEIVASGKPLSVIAETRDGEGYYSAHSDSYVEVKFFSEKENLHGNIINVVPVSHNNGIIYCEVE